MAIVSTATSANASRADSVSHTCTTFELLILHFGYTYGGGFTQVQPEIATREPSSDIPPELTECRTFNESSFRYMLEQQREKQNISPRMYIGLLCSELLVRDGSDVVVSLDLIINLLLHFGLGREELINRDLVKGLLRGKLRELGLEGHNLRLGLLNQLGRLGECLQWRTAGRVSRME